jgi:hypothetical protein
MVGRGAELTRLLRLLERAAEPQVALIGGEAGVGKTRPVQELLTVLPDGVTVLAGQAEQAGPGRPYQLLLEAVEPFVADWTALPEPLGGREHALRLPLAPVAPSLGGQDAARGRGGRRRGLPGRDPAARGRRPGALPGRQRAGGAARPGRPRPDRRGGRRRLLLPPRAHPRGGGRPAARPRAAALAREGPGRSARAGQPRLGGAGPPRRRRRSLGRDTGGRPHRRAALPAHRLDLPGAAPGRAGAGGGRAGAGPRPRRCCAGSAAGRRPADRRRSPRASARWPRCWRRG